jgi:dTDP-4-amino-4,6-dideoxygalactose transaminase
MIQFNNPTITGKEKDYIIKTLSSGKYSGEGVFNRKCSTWIETTLKCNKAFITSSCTHALEFSSILIDIKPGDEIIMPSFTFTSTANAFVLRGAKIVFVDIRPDTMNIDENRIEDAVTDRTRAIVVVHYAGVSCEMDIICGIAEKHGLLVIEDAAQAILSTYKKKYLGTIGDIGTLSFHETKNIQSGEGGAILINNSNFIDRAEIVREKGTNRIQFMRGDVDKYTWVDIGSSYLPPEVVTAFLFAQLEMAEFVINARLKVWNMYYNTLNPLSMQKAIEIPHIPDNCKHNGHLFFIKVDSLRTRTRLIDYLKKKEIQTVFHYIPLHNSPFGKKAGRFHSDDKWTTIESQRLLRLPLWYGISPDQVMLVIDGIYAFFNQHI